MTRCFFLPEGAFCLRGVLARGGFLQEGGFVRRRGFAGGGVWPEAGFCPEGFFPLPIDNNGGYTKYLLYSGKHLRKYLYIRKTLVLNNAKNYA